MRPRPQQQQGRERQVRPRGPPRRPERQGGDAGRGGEAPRDGPGQDPGEGSYRLSRGLEGEGRAADGAAEGALWSLGGREREEGDRRG